jgi:hypothetical protein
VDLDQPGLKPADEIVEPISREEDNDVPCEAPNALLSLVNRLDIRLFIVSPPEMDILLRLSSTPTATPLPADPCSPPLEHSSWALRHSTASLAKQNKSLSMGMTADLDI